MIAELHVAPDPAGTAQHPYTHIEAAIAVIEQSGLDYEVGALGTTVEGPDDSVWEVLRAAHRACLDAGADRVITSIRIAEWAEDGPTISTLTEKFRQSESTHRPLSAPAPSPSRSPGSSTSPASSSSASSSAASSSAASSSTASSSAASPS